MQQRELLEKLICRIDLSKNEMEWLIQQMLQGNFTEVQVAGFLVALASKGESETELTAAVQVLRSMSHILPYHSSHLLDIVGTGGDSLQTFNISTACCFIVAAAGVTVTKHGNRSSSSKSGSADVLECAGVNLQQSTEEIISAIKTLGIGFLYAPNFHSAMAQVSSVRKQLKIRTIFNLLGPLSNPANAQYHLIGVYDERWLLPFARVLQNLSSKKALIVCGAEGLDEISLAGETKVAELSEGNIQMYSIFPEQFGINRHSLDVLRVATPVESLNMILAVFNNQMGPARDIVLLNAGAALYAADKVASIQDGINLSQSLLASGKVLNIFDEFRRFTE